MNYIDKLLLLITLLLFSSCKNNEHLKNKPKEILKYFVNKQVEKYNKGSLLERIKFSYDENGNKIEENYYGMDNKLEKTYKYNNKGNLIETEEQIGNSKLSLIYKYTNKYDGKGRLIAWKVNRKNAPNPDTTATYKYDENNNIIERLYYIHRYETNLVTKFVYDMKGNKTEENNYSNKKLTLRKTYKYNERGNEIEVSLFKSDNMLMYRYTYQYDEKGNMIEYNSFNSNEAEATASRKETNRYDERNNLIEEITISGPYYFKTKYKYDDRRNLIDAKTYNSDESINERTKGKIPLIIDTIYFK